MIEWLSPSGLFRDDVTLRAPVAAVDTRPTIYVHIRTEGDRLAALAWQGLLRAQEQQAAPIRDRMSRAGATVQAKYLPEFEDSKRVRPLQFEVWFADDAIGYWFPVVASI